MDRGIVERWGALALSLGLLVAACTGSADSCNEVIDDAAGILVETLDAARTGGEDVSFTEEELAAIPDRMDALGCDPQAVSFEAMTEYASDNGMTEDEQGIFFLMLLSLLDGSLLD